MMDVPAHIELSSHMHNGATVIGGTNWDVSRSAVTTPIRALPVPVPEPALTRYTPDTGLAGKEPVATLTFARDAKAVARADARALCALPAGTYAVAGHAHAQEKHPKSIASARAGAVAQALRACGFSVHTVQGFAAQLPAPGDGAELSQRRVEVFHSR